MQQTDYVLRPENQKRTLRIILLLAPVFLFHPLLNLILTMVAPTFAADWFGPQLWFIGAPYLYFAFLAFIYFERIRLKDGFITAGFKKRPLSSVIEVAGDEGDIRNDFNESIVLRFDDDDVMVLPVRSFDEQELRTFISALKQAHPTCNYTYSDIIPFESRGLIRFLLNANESSSLTVRLSKTPMEDAIFNLLKSYEQTFFIMYFAVLCIALGVLTYFCYNFNAWNLIHPGVPFDWDNSAETLKLAALINQAEGAPSPDVMNVLGLRVSMFFRVGLDYFRTDGLTALSAIWMLISGVLFVLIPMFRAYSPAFIFIDPQSIGMRMSFLYWPDITMVSLEKLGEMGDPLEGKLVLIDAVMNRLDIELDKVPDIQTRHKILRLVDRYAVNAKFNDEFMRTTNTLFDIQFTDMWLDEQGSNSTTEVHNDSEQPTSLCGGVYRVERLLGYGGQGVTYLANTDGRTIDGAEVVPKGQVVVKELVLPNYADVRIMQDATSRFERGARLLSQLNHPQVVRLLDYFVENGKAYLVLEYIQGQTLRDVVERHGAFSPAEVKKFGLQMCEILSFLHDRENPVIHCDFAPDNLILTPAGKIKLLDFDVARVVDSTAHTFIAGRPSYTPPEQFRGKPIVRSDIFAMGAILHFLLAGEDPPPLCAGTLESSTTDGEGVDALLKDIIKQCCAFESDERPESAKAVADALSSSQSQSESDAGHVIKMPGHKINVGKLEEVE